MCLACQIWIKRKCSHASVFTFWSVTRFQHGVLQSTHSICQYRLFTLAKGRLLKAKVNQGKLIYQFKLKHGDDGLALLSSPIERRLSRDLVVVSHWEAGHKPSTSPKNSAPWRNKAPKNKSEESESHGNLTLNERFTKLQSPTSSSQEQKERRSSGSPEKTLRKPGSFQRPNFRPTTGVKRGSAPDGVIRKPLMGTLIPRPPFNQKPVFKKSQSIMSKYKNLQTLRHKVPHQRQATSYRRW